MCSQARWAVTNLVRGGAVKGVCAGAPSILSQKGKDFVRGSVSLQLLLTSRKDVWRPWSPLTVAQVLWAVERVLKECRMILEPTDPWETESRPQIRALWLG